MNKWRVNALVCLVIAVLQRFVAGEDWTAAIVIAFVSIATIDILRAIEGKK